MEVNFSKDKSQQASKLGLFKNHYYVEHLIMGAVIGYS